MQLNGLGLYQSNALAQPWFNSSKAAEANVVGKELADSNRGTVPLSANKVAALAPKSLVSNGKLAKVNGIGDELQVSPTSNTRAEVSRANLSAQTAQAAVTTAKAVNDSLGKTEMILAGMSDIVSALANPGTLTVSRRQELSGQFGQLSAGLDVLVSGESFAGHKTLDGKFRATFSVGGESKVTIDATLPNGKAFSVEGLGLEGFAVFLSENGATLQPEQGEAMGRGLDIARSAVSQVRSGLDQAADAAMGAMTETSPLMSSEVGGSREIALNLAQAAKESVKNGGAAAFRAQANTAMSSALRLLV
ncbi:MAG: FlaA [Mobiluncus porci]|uniref:FlaA n=1 Tax=Mobiluncus porci TaxID=2652278 RepID=A0A7K0K5G6_9ACTO|nr:MULTISPECIES: FlaA [Mobiluncus]MCI6584069.1 FlaA [Mobiluncus sp.]MDD7541043.1 FlaA [Mobiluncus porci]MDY5749307.1 FlaA [Mobiluncus porci]MST50679.1 FlaA [Mobiluncus porci]